MLGGLMIAVAIVTAFRFNQRDLGVIGALTGTGTDGNLGDAAQYIRYVEAIRGNVDSLPPAPFRYRPLTPVLAAPLPFDAMTSLNVVNVLALMVGSLSMWALLRGFGTSERMATFGGLLLVISFPTFYYGSIGYVDPLAISLMTAVLAAVVAERHVAVVGLMAAAALTRESTVVIVVVAIVWLWATGYPRRQATAWGLAWALVFLVCVSAVRLALHGSGTNLWQPSLDTLSNNIRRPRTWLSAALTLGVPVGLAIVYRKPLRLVDRPHRLVIACGSLLCFALFGYSLMAAYADGRFLWPIYVFSVPAAVLAIQAANVAGKSDSSPLND